MSNVSNNGSGGSVKAPAFTLRSLNEIKKGLPKKYWEKFLGIENKRILKRLKEGVRVRVLAQSVGHPKNPCEELWVRIHHKDTKARKYVGSIVSNVGRHAYHGLMPGMLINFQEKHTLDVWMEDLE